MSDTNSQFIQASRLKLRFPSTRGEIAVEDLWDLSLEKLDTLGVGLRKAAAELNTESLIVTSRRDTDHLQLKFDLVKYVIDVKLAEAAARKEAALKAQKLASLKDLAQRKQLQEFEGRPLAEIQAEIAALEGAPVAEAPVPVLEKAGA